MDLGDLIRRAEFTAEDYLEYRLVTANGKDVVDVVFDPDVAGTATLILADGDWEPLGFRELHGRA